MAGCPLCDREHARGSAGCPASRLGTTFALKYELERLLGVGGMGAVYLAEHIELRTKVAVKVLLPRFTTDGEVVQRFLTEARSAAALAHPGIVQIRDLGRSPEGEPYIEMERLVGQGLRELADDGPVSIPLALEIATQALDALAAAHDAGVVHRDLKPENVFVCEGNQVKLLDFGIAKIVGDWAEAHVTRTGAFLGTPLYASPEQLRDARTVDARSDLYSLGATLYEVITGRPTIEATTAIEAVANVLEGRVDKQVAEHRPDAPPWLDAAIAKSLAAKPEDRFENAKEMRAAFRPSTQKKKMDGPVALGLANTMASDPGDEPIPPASPGPEPKKPWLAAAIGVGVVAIAGVVLAMSLGGNETAETHAIEPPEAVEEDAGPPEPEDPSTLTPEGMVFVAGGSFRMGSTSGEIDRAMETCRSQEGDGCRRDLYEREQPVREVHVSSFYMDAHEVTNAEWGQGREEMTPDLPVVSVSWQAAREHCEARGGDLPTEAQWEWAARGESRRRFPWGDARPACSDVVFGRREQGAFCPGPVAPQVVGSAPGDVTPEGIHDLAGNVGEWTRDSLAMPYPDCGECRDPVVDVGTSLPRVFRGGYFRGAIEGLRSAGRNRPAGGALTLEDLGFRCVRPLP